MTPEGEREILRRLASIDATLSVSTLFFLEGCAITAAVYAYQLFASNASNDNSPWTVIALGAAIATFFAVNQAIQVMGRRLSTSAAMTTSDNAALDSNEEGEREKETGSSEPVLRSYSMPLSNLLRSVFWAMVGLLGFLLILYATAWFTTPLLIPN